MNPEVKHLQLMLSQCANHINDVGAGAWPDEEYTMDSALFLTRIMLEEAVKIMKRWESDSAPIVYNIPKTDGISDMERLTFVLP